MTNNQAIGYAILTLKKLGVGTEFVQNFEREMIVQLDEKTESEAERAYMEN